MQFTSQYVKKKVIAAVRNMEHLGIIYIKKTKRQKVDLPWYESTQARTEDLLCVRQMR